MKRTFVLPGLLLLAACSSTGDAGRVGGGYTMNQYQNMRASNMLVTNLAQTVTNRSEVVDYAKSVGVVVDTTSQGQSTDTNSRYAVTPGHSPNQSDRDKIPVANRQFADAVAAFKNMYKIYSNDDSGITEKELRSAYMIAGGSADDYSWDISMTDADKDMVREYVSERAVDLLDKYFDKDAENGYNFDGRSMDLSDVEMKSVSGDTVLSFDLNEHGEIVGVNLSGDYLTRRNSAGRQFYKTTVSKENGYTDTTNIAIVNYGKEMALQYADFGYITSHTTRTFDDKTLAGQVVDKISVIAGGYDLKNISRADMVAMDSEMNFDGMAVGVITGKDGTEKIIAGNANLNFKDGVETLRAKFANGSLDVDNEYKWYDVEIENDGTGASITFKPGDNEIDRNYQLSGMTDSGKTVDNYTDFEILYYGDHGMPSEFVGTATYQDDVENGVSMSTAFGGALIKTQE